MSQNLSEATWIDVNSGMALNNYPDRLPDEIGIQISSFFNLLKCPIGARGRTFQPQYGTILYHLLQEPVHPSTADKIQLGFIQAIERWEPRIVLDYSQTSVTPDNDLPGYRIRLVFSLRLSDETYAAVFAVSQR